MWDVAFLTYSCNCLSIIYMYYIVKFFFANQVLGILLHLRISHIDIQSLNQYKEKKSTVEMKIEKNKNRMEKKLKGKMSKKEKKVHTFCIPLWCHSLLCNIMSCNVAYRYLYIKMFFKKSLLPSRAGTKCY